MGQTHGGTANNTPVPSPAKHATSSPKYSTLSPKHTSSTLSPKSASLVSKHFRTSPPRNSTPPKTAATFQTFAPPIRTDTPPISDLAENCADCPHVHDEECKYTCHHRCRQLITLDCEGAGNEGSSEAQASCSTTEESTNGKAMVKESGEFESGYETNDRPDYSSLPKEDIRRRIEEFNSKNTNHGLLMEMREDGLTFQGFIRVNMNLTRPINMSIGVRPPSIYDVLTHEDIEDDHTQTTSFYLPRDTVKALHITSDTTTREVISLLLHKFHITDNPHKFALYHHFIGENNKLQIRKLPDGEKPLQLWLKWEEEESESQWKLVLQENETGEIMWEAFSIPELSNFLEILDREEKEHIEQLRTKYKVKKLQLNARVREIASEANDRGESTA